MQTLQTVAVMLGVSQFFALAGVAHGQAFPTKPIRILTAAAGGGSDFDARQIGQGISGPLGQPVVVDNRTAALAAEGVARAAADGHTLLVGGGTLWIIPLLQKAPWDAIKDFAPITLIERTVNVVAVHPSIPARSVTELVALAKRRPGELNYASGAVGGPTHLGAELFNSMAGINIVGVPYKGSAATVTALVSGEVQVLFVDSGLVMPHAKTGKLRALAVTSLDPSALTPGLPTVAASGLPGYELLGMTALLAPANTPTAIVTRLNQEVVRFLNRPEVRERFLNAGVEIVANSPDEMAATIRAEIAKWTKVIREAKITSN